MFKYETHCHTCEGSACAYSTAREMVQAYKKAGYAGIIFTNHFIKGNTSVPLDLDWNKRMQMYYDAYLEAKDEGEKIDFDVFFGIEHAYGKGKEILIYGIDLEFLQSHPELQDADIETYSQLVHDAGGLMIHAHPHRKRIYIKEGVAPRYDVCDGIEVYNACDDSESNQSAMNAAIRLDMIMFAGGDIHKDHDRRIGMAGIVVEERIKTNEKLIETLKNKRFKLVIDGEIRSNIEE